MTLIKRFIFACVVLVLSVSVLISKPFQLGLDLKGGVSIVLEAQDVDDRQVTNDDVLGVIDVIRGRINALGLTEPV
ncbi:MAG: protein translocase subunit SecD, partial [Candidatus Margulisiibacteriota bacterium]|nr:protein translocase subunit SecD [Candidatus Margulisiibacteriota bacterium]